MFVALLSGCASYPVRQQTPTIHALQQIAADFTAILIQLESLQPDDSPLLWSEITQPSDPFSAVLRTELEKKGYDIMASDDRDDEHAIGYFKVPNAFSEDGVSGSYIVSVGNLQLSRSYRFLEDSSMIATSDMVARGADMSRIRLDQSAVPTVRTMEAAPVDTAEEVTASNDGRSLYAGVRNLADEPAGREPFLNLVNVHEEILRFDSESTLLSRQGRALLQIVANRFDATSDVVLLVGCSQGKSREEITNAWLAVTRAQVAGLTLQNYGVPERNIFEAGCWTDEVIDLRFPQSGVVATLKREVY